MIDTVTMRFHRYRADIEDVLENCQKMIKPTGEVKNIGFYRGFRVNQDSYGLHLTGSLWKFIAGNNVQDISINDIREGLEKLGSDLSLDLAKSNVYRIDIAGNLELDEPVERYLPAFGSFGRFSKGDYEKTGVQYLSQEKAFSFYDKAAEARKKKQELPEAFRGKNILRYELRFKKRLKQNLGRNISAKDLYDKELIKQLIDIWRDSYQKIEKIQTIEPAGNFPITSRNFDQLLKVIGLQQITPRNLLALIQSSSQSPSQKSRLRGKVKQLQRSGRLIRGSPLIDELDRKITGKYKDFV